MKTTEKTTEKKTETTFVKERKNTDESLGAERDKTNRSLSNARTKAEDATDHDVQGERDQADLKRSAARSDADSKSPAKKSVLAERSRSDQAIEVERSRVDIAIVREREVKKAVAGEILSQERQHTDHNLAAERTVTDTHVASGSVRLTQEMADHTKTKTNLTTRDEFLAIVSHDLRNPIGAISSCMEMLLEESDERKIDPETKVWLELAKRNADSSLRLIGDLLDMERVAEGKLKVVPERCDIGPIIQEAVEIFTQAAAAKNVLLRSIPPDTTCAINCDHDRIVQVLSNLISNALKFTPEQGKVVVKTTWDAETVTVSVCDTGPGIPPEKKEQIFEKFAQLGSKDRTGLGLGLHISKMLVEAHGGKLTVESTPGAGCTFFVKLPLRKG